MKKSFKAGAQAVINDFVGENFDRIAEETKNPLILSGDYNANMRRRKIGQPKKFAD